MPPTYSTAAAGFREWPPWKRLATPALCLFLGLAAPWLPWRAGIVAGLALVLALPGWALGAAAGRGRTLPDRVAWGYAGLGLATVALWWSGTLLGTGRWPALVTLAVVAGVVGLGLGRRWREPPATADASGGAPATRDRWLLGSAALIALLVLTPFLPHGTEVAAGFRKLGMTDWYKHLLVATSLSTTPALPPANPFLLAAGPFVYYFGFHLAAATAYTVAGGDQGLFASLVLLTLATAAASPFVLYRFCRRLELERRTALIGAVGGTLLAGFDLVVMGVETLRTLVAAGLPGLDFQGLRALVPSTHLNFWIHHKIRQFNPPYMALIWAPQHWAATLLALLALGLLLSPAGPGVEPGGRRSLGRTLAVAVLLAALPAISAYVAIGTVIVLGTVAVYGFVLEGREAGWRHLRAWIPPGALSALLAAPVVALLRRGAGQRLALELSPAGGWSNGAFFSSLFGDAWWTRLADTPVVLLVQLGIVGILGVAGIVRRLRRHGHGGAGDADASGPASPADLLAPAPVVLLLVLTFVRPPMAAPNNNDFYSRQMLLVWCLLVPYAAAAWGGVGRRLAWKAAVAICAAGTLYAALGATLEGVFFRPSPAGVVLASGWVNLETAPDTLVAVRPEDFGVDFGYWLRRRVVLTEPRYAEVFGASPERFAGVSDELSAAFTADSSRAAARRLDALGAGVAITSEAPAWPPEPCFRVAFHQQGWWVLERLPEACR